MRRRRNYREQEMNYHCFEVNIEQRKRNMKTEDEGNRGVSMKRTFLCTVERKDKEGDESYREEKL